MIMLAHSLSLSHPKPLEAAISSLVHEALHQHSQAVLAKKGEKMLEGSSN
jgi:hypothetical protein